MIGHRAAWLFALGGVFLGACGGPEPQATPWLAGEDAERWTWQAPPLPASKATIRWSGSDLEQWTVKGSPPAREVADGDLVLQVQDGTRLTSPELQLDCSWLDQILLRVDTGDARGTAFVLEWTTDLGTGSMPLQHKDAGRQSLQIDLASEGTWKGQLQELRYVARTGGKEFTTRIEYLELRGQLSSLVQSTPTFQEVRLAHEYRPAWSALVPTESSLTFTCPSQAKLHLGLGLLAARGETGVRISAEAEGEATTLHEANLSAGETWRDLSLDLGSWSSKELTLRIQADSAGSTPGVLLVSDPILRSACDRQRPNLVLYLTDTLRADHIAPYGYTRNATPALAAFARDAVVFQRALAPSNWTKSSMVSLMTSTWLGRHGVPHRTRITPEELTTLAQVLRRAGYRTGSFLTNRIAGHDSGLERGFSALYDATRVPDPDPARSLPPRTLDWLEAHADEPFFLYVHTAEPHDPYEPPDPHRLDSDYAGPVDGRNFPKRATTAEEIEEVKRLYDGEVAHADQVFGDFLDHLRELELYDDAWIVFTSDHGEAFQEHGRWRHRASLYAHQVEVPLIVRQPNGRLGGEKRSDFASLIDVVPTLLAGLDLGGPDTLQGHNLFSVDPRPGVLGPPGILSEASAAHRAGPGHLEWAYTTGRYKVILANDFNKDRETIRAFDLVADPEEQHPLEEPWPREVADLIQALRTWRDDTRRAPAEAGSGIRDLGYLQELEALGYAGEDSQ